jgi:lysine biosynthesis protein LysW
MAWCPECESMMLLDKEVKRGEVIKCPACSVLLEVIGLEPLELDYAENEEWEEEDSTMAWCPECDSRIEMGERVKLGTQLECSECGTMLEVISLKPLELDYAVEDEEWEEEEEGF